MAQEEKTTTEAAVAAREKKAAKKARRKERDGALKAAEGSTSAAASVTPTVADATATAAHDAPLGSTHTATASEQAAASPQTAAAAQHTADTGSDTHRGRRYMEDAAEMRVSAHVERPTPGVIEQTDGAAAGPQARQHHRAATAGDDALTHLLGGLGVSERSQPQAELAGSQQHPAPGPVHGQRSSAVPSASASTASKEYVGRHRSAALEADAHLMCPITKVCLQCLPR